jgi:hypothetical protein
LNLYARNRNGERAQVNDSPFDTKLREARGSKWAVSALGCKIMPTLKI